MSKSVELIPCPHCGGTGKLEATLGSRIGMARGFANMSVRDLATAIGASAALVRRYEDNLNDPSLHNLREMARVLNVADTWLLAGIGDGPSTKIAPEGTPKS